MMTATEMTRAYETLAFTHHYMMGYVVNHMVYMTIVEGCADYMRADHASSNRGGAIVLRFKPTAAQKKALMAINAVEICTEAELEAQFASCKYNRGEVFERMLTERFGQVWVKDKTPFTVDGDLTVDGVAYQIKYQDATFCSEKSLRNLGWVA